MFELLFEQGATAESIEAFLTACFSPMHVRAATDYGEYDPESGKVTPALARESRDASNAARVLLWAVRCPAGVCRYAMTCSATAG